MFLLTIQDQLLKVQIKVDRRLKGIRLSYENAALLVRTPYPLSQARAKQLIQHHADLVKTLIDDADKKTFEDNRRYQDQLQVPFRGSALTINTVSSKELKPKVHRIQDALLIELPELFSSQDLSSIIKRALLEWYCNQAQQYFQYRLDFWSEKIGVKYNKLRIKFLKSRWGSCSSKGNINLNGLIIMAPDWISDYVLIHELCHLRYMNHSKQFWGLVRQYAPDYREARKWLHQNGSSLHL